MTYSSYVPEGFNDNQYVQASHQLVRWLERAKEHVERILDGIGEVYCLVTEAGEILRCNALFASFAGADPEDLLHKSLARFFAPADWDAFVGRMSGLEASERCSFEMPLIHCDGHPVLHRWSVTSILDSVKGTGRHVYAILGEDLSVREQCHARWDGLLGALSAGVLEIGSDLKLCGNGNSALGKILGRPALAGMPLEAVLFGAISPSLQAGEREAVQRLGMAFSGPLAKAESLLAGMPREAFLPRVDGKGFRSGVPGVWLELRFVPVCVRGRLERLLVLVEERAAQRG